MSDSFGTPWTVALQAPLSMGFPRQEYWSGLPSPPPPGDLPDRVQSYQCYQARISSQWEKSIRSFYMIFLSNEEGDHQPSDISMAKVSGRIVSSSSSLQNK